MEEALLNLIAQFNAQGVEYVVVGGHAVNAYGLSRTTDDLDILIRPTPANAPRAVQALINLGYAQGEFEEADFLRTPSFLSFGYQGEWIDLMTQIKGATFEACWDQATTVELAGVPVRFMSLRALRQSKAATGRPQDITDLANLPPAPTDPPA